MNRRVDVRAGHLDRKVDIYAQARSDDGAGGYSKAWQYWDSVWARFEPLSGAHRMEAMAQNLEIAGRVTVRYRTDLPIPAVIKFGGQYMRSLGPVVNENDRRTHAVYDVQVIQEPVLASNPTPTPTPSE